MSYSDYIASCGQLLVSVSQFSPFIVFLGLAVAFVLIKLVYKIFGMGVSMYD